LGENLGRAAKEKKKGDLKLSGGKNPSFFPGKGQRVPEPVQKNPADVTNFGRGGGLATKMKGRWKDFEKGGGWAHI